MILQRMFRVYRGLLVFCFFIVLPSQAQLTLQGGVGVGAVLPAGDLGGATTDYYAGTKYGLSTGYNAHAKARLGALGFRFAREISYSSLSNSGNSEPGQGNVDTKQKIVSFSVGPEYSISIPLSPITPYFGAHAALHLISGETTFQGVSKVPSGTFTLQSGSRLGVGGTAGVVLGMGPLMNLDIAAHYEAMNPFSKSWEDANTSADQRIDSYLTVNDDKDPQYAANNDKHFIAGSRSISVLSFTVTLMFGL